MWWLYKKTIIPRVNNGTALLKDQFSVIVSFDLLFFEHALLFGSRLATSSGCTLEKASAPQERWIE